MDDRHTLSAVVLQFALACDLCTLVYLTTLLNGPVGLWYPHMLLVCAPAVYGLNRLFLRRSRTVRSMVLFNGALLGAMVLSDLLLSRPGDWAELVFQVLFCLWITVQGARMAVEPPSLHSLILCLDISAVLFLLFVAMIAATGLSLAWCLPGAAGCAAAVLGLIACRISRPMGLRGWGPVLLAFFGLFAGVWLLVRFAAAPAGQGLVALWTGLAAGARYLLALAGRFLLFLFSLLPDPDTGELEEPEPFEMPGFNEEEMAENPVAAMVMAVLAVMLLAALVIWGLRMLGRLRVGGVKGKKTAERQKRERSSLWSALVRLWNAWMERLRLRAFLRRNRDTAVGLFYLLVRKCRLGPWRKRPEETPREFLGRLRLSAAEDPELAAALDGLIPAVDEALYGRPARRQTVPEAGLIRRRVGAAVWGQLWRDLRAGAGERLSSLLAGLN